MSWRRFGTLVYGLSPDAVFRILSGGGSKPRPLTAKEAPAFFARFPKRGEK